MIDFAKKILGKGAVYIFKEIFITVKYYTEIIFEPLLEVEKKAQCLVEEHKGIKGIIFFTPFVDWGMPLHQRPHQLAKAFAKNGYLVFYATLNLRNDRVRGIEKVSENLYLTNWVSLFRHQPTWVYVYTPLGYFYSKRLKNRQKLLYDYMDEIEVFRGKYSKKDNNHKQYLIKSSDIVLASADSLYKEAKKINKKTFLVENAADYRMFSDDKAMKIPKNLKAIKKPIIGYYGAIAEWVDYDLILFAAESRPDYSFVFVGPTNYDNSKEIISELNELPNIYFLGSKKYAEIPSYLSGFDVATIPFKVNEITNSTSPIKLFEYMSGGRPIVTTDIKECNKYQSVLVAKNHKQYVSLLDKALTSNWQNKNKNVIEKEARENSWGKRAELIDGIIKD